MAEVAPIKAKDGLPPGALTIDDAVERLGFGKFQVLLSLFTGLGWVSPPHLEC